MLHNDSNTDCRHCGLLAGGQEDCYKLLTFLLDTLEIEDTQDATQLINRLVFVQILTHGDHTDYSCRKAI